MKKLLQLLEDDCTLTHAQLASLANMTEAEVAAAIRQYEEDKVILGYKAIVDWDRTDRESVTALIEVKVTPQRGEGFDRVAQRIYQYDEVPRLNLIIIDSVIILQYYANSVPGLKNPCFIIERQEDESPLYDFCVNVYESLKSNAVELGCDL